MTLLVAAIVPIEGRAALGEQVKGVFRPLGQPVDQPGADELHAVHFDLLINLDKDREACALASTIPAATKMGFLLQGGSAAPAGPASRRRLPSSPRRQRRDRTG